MGKKTIKLGIDKFNLIPQGLNGYDANPREIEFETGKLFHHFYLMKYGEDESPPGVYEYERFLADCRDWRYRGTGIGRDKESKRNVSNELAKAFTRWFLYTYEGVTYFAPFEDQFKTVYPNGYRWKKIEEGNLPDFVCGPDETNIRLAEAKGRYSSVSFSNENFEGFRGQIRRVVLEDAVGKRIGVKGYVSACQWATENTPRTKTKLLVEDPYTEGEAPLNGTYPHGIGHRMVAHHYVSVLERLMLPAHAEALQHNLTISESIGHSLSVWEVSVGPLKGKRFVGGVLPYQNAVSCCNYMYHGWRRSAPFLHPPATIFAVEENIFSQVLRVCNAGIDAAREISTLEIPEEFTSRMTVLRDGTLLAPDSYLRWVGEIEI